MELNDDDALIEAGYDEDLVRAARAVYDA